MGSLTLPRFGFNLLVGELFTAASYGVLPVSVKALNTFVLKRLDSGGLPSISNPLLTEPLEILPGPGIISSTSGSRHRPLNQCPARYCTVSKVFVPLVTSVFTGQSEHNRISSTCSSAPGSLGKLIQVSHTGLRTAFRDSFQWISAHTVTSLLVTGGSTVGKWVAKNI